eukprot:Seg4618.2 transcript_id=Seg4618.2/GoldUCD/mRNA.D3Y31 product="Major facilitator superfamily domain-containing protein 10" protein_id=Seg4618.2/GoldUCD/D3Y31
MAKEDAKVMIRIFIILVLDLIAFTAILPLLPAILSHYESRIRPGQDADTEDSLLKSCLNLLDWMKEQLHMPNLERYNNVLLGGFLGSIFSFLQFVGNPIFGALSDIFGRKRILLFSMLGTAVSYFVWLKSNSFTSFLVSRIIGGISKGSVTIVTAIMSDITTKETRGKGMALIGIAFAVGFTIGPLFGAYFAIAATSSNDQPFFAPAMFSFGLQALAVILALAMFNETLTTSSEVTLKDRLSVALDLINPIVLLKTNWNGSKGVDLIAKSQLTLIHFTYLLFFSGLEFTLTFLTHQRYGFESRQQGLLFLYIGLVMLLVQGGYVRRVKHGKEKSVALSGMLCMIPSMVIIALGDSMVSLCIALFLYSFGAAAVIPCLTALFSQRSHTSESGELLGIFRSAGALARAIGPLLMCSIYWTFGSTICYLIGACFFIVPIFLCHQLHVQHAKEG